MPLLSAWNERRKGARGGPTLDSAKLEKYTEIALYNHGVFAGALVADPAMRGLSRITPGLPGNLFVHRIGR